MDVAALGAGFTGLWTALELLKREPSLRVAVVEREIACFGAPGALLTDRVPGAAGRRGDRATPATALVAARIGGRRTSAVVRLAVKDAPRR